MFEQWKDNKNLEGLYQVSNFGQIMSLNYRKTGKAKLMKLIKSKKGYLTVTFYKNGEYKKFLVHRLVAEHFIPNPDNLPFINHKDEDKKNNFAGTPENDYKDGNLEWCSNEYNSNYGTRNRRISSTNTNGKLSKPVLQFTLSGELIREFPSMAECTRNGFNQSAVCLCCQGKRKSAYGFKWCYV